jgi:hypothetical protein
MFCFVNYKTRFVYGIQILDGMFLLLTGVEHPLPFLVLRPWYMLFCINYKGHKTWKYASISSIVFNLLVTLYSLREGQTLSYQWFYLLNVLAYVTRVQTKEEFHQGVGYVKPVIDQNHDNSILNNKLEASTSSNGSFSIFIMN